MTKVLKELVEKVDINNFSCNGNARIKNNMAPNSNEEYFFVDSLIDLAQLRKESALEDKSMKNIQSEIQREKNK